MGHFTSTPSAPTPLRTSRILEGIGVSLFRWESAPEFCDPSIPPEEFLGPSGPKLETELKMSSRGLPAPGPKKVLKTESKKSRKMEISTLFQLFRLFFDSVFKTFLVPGAARSPGTHFQLRFQTLGLKGPRTPLGGLKGRNRNSPFANQSASAE